MMRLRASLCYTHEEEAEASEDEEDGHARG